MQQENYSIWLKKVEMENHIRKQQQKKITGKAAAPTLPKNKCIKLYGTRYIYKSVITYQKLKFVEWQWAILDDMN